MKPLQSRTQSQPKISEFVKAPKVVGIDAVSRPYQINQILSSWSLKKFQIRFPYLKILADPEICSKNSAIDSFWWTGNDPVKIENFYAAVPAK